MTPIRVRLQQLLIVALMCALVAASAGCNRQQTAAATDKRTGDGLVIGWSQRSLTGSDWYKTLLEGAEDRAEALGAHIEILDGNGDTTRQIQDVQTFITKDVDVVVMNANDPIGVAAAAKDLKEAGIPLVTVNSNLDPSLLSQVFCYVAENQVATARMAGRHIAQKAVAKWGRSGEIKIVGIGGDPGDVLSELRYRGFRSGYRSVMRLHPKVRTIWLPFRYGEWLPDQALGPIRDVATANPDLKIVFSESDVMQAGIQQALKQAGLWGEGILQASYDGGMNVVGQMVRDPSGPIQADASNQPWDQGRVAIDMALAAFNRNTAACPSGTRYVDTTLVTPQNAEKYYDPEATYVGTNVRRAR